MFALLTFACPALLTGQPRRVVARPRRRRRGVVRFGYATTEFLIGGVTGDLRLPQELILGRYTGTGELLVAGRTTPLDTAAANQVGPQLASAGEEHPWPERLPPGWHDGRESIEYVRVVPELVVEARVDAATIGGSRWRHGARYVRMRPDLTSDDAPPTRQRSPTARDPVPCPWQTAGPITAARDTGTPGLGRR